ncbi:MAG: asparaginase [Burkholderiales bacterium]|nr:asparaginase [Burkholderiales bacterium]
MAGKIVVLGTGGTIAGKAAAPGDNLGYTAAQLGVQDLLAAIPALAGLPIATEQVAQLDSKDMGPTAWRDLALRCAHWLAQPDLRGIVITHGTDTLEETAFFLQALLAPAKPVVVTCAMRPATALAPDGPQNLVDAIAVAQAPGARGVVAVCAGVIHGAREVRKVHPYRLDAFSSGDAGPLGHIEDGLLRIEGNWPAERASHAQAAMEKIASGAPWPRVEIVTSHAGAGGALVEALIQQGVDGLVVAATGNGSVHRELEAALLAAQAHGIRVVRSTRCEQGRVLPHRGDVLPHSDGLSPVKARIALLLELMAL